jgi:hypothetical protein
MVVLSGNRMDALRKRSGTERPRSVNVIRKRPKRRTGRNSEESAERPDDQSSYETVAATRAGSAKRIDICAGRTTAPNLLQSRLLGFRYAHHDVIVP